MTPGSWLFSYTSVLFKYIQRLLPSVVCFDFITPHHCQFTDSVKPTSLTV